MNRFLRRLLQLEDQTPRSTPRRPTAAALSDSIRAKIGLPLPAAATPAERERGLRLFREAVESLRRDANDQAGFRAVATYVQSIHAKYSQAGEGEL